MTEEARTIQGLFDESKITEDDMRIRFEIDGFKFFYNKKTGLMRKRQKAANILQFISDELGMAAGKYDEILDMFISGLVVEIDDVKNMIGDDISYDEFISSIPEVNDNGEFAQMSMMQSLPYILALAILGKLQVSAMMEKVGTLI